MVAFNRCLKKSHVFLKLLGFLVLTLFYCEYLHYYVTISQCRWPELEKGDREEVHAMVVADTHLLGSRNGHWFDKLRREWQMHRAFQSAVTLHSPDVVIFLGDLFDEGKWCSNEEFSTSVEHFSHLFALPNTTRLIVVPGNHDMGFHYSITPLLAGRFEQAFSVSSVSATAVRGVLFVAVNSMALHGDDCFLCTAASDKLAGISRELSCGSVHGPCPASRLLPTLPSPPPRPVLLQHYPLYRPSDAECQDTDAAPLEERGSLFRERWECLSKESSHQLLSQLTPRLVLSGHTHHGCTTLHQHPPLLHTPLQVQPSPTPTLPSADADYAAEEADYYERQQAAIEGPDHDRPPPLTVPEVTVPSFSWRNKKSPTFAMVTLSPELHSITKCEMPREQTVVLLYCAACFLFLLSLPRRKLWWLAPLHSLLTSTRSDK